MWSPLRRVSCKNQANPHNFLDSQLGQGDPPPRPWHGEGHCIWRTCNDLFFFLPPEGQPEHPSKHSSLEPS